MTWKDFYDKIYNDEIGNIIADIEALDDMGSSDEITDAICVIFEEDRNAAMHLLHKAFALGIKLSGANLSVLSEFCSEDNFRKALFQSADAFDESDLEELSDCIDDELMMELVTRFHLPLPIDYEQWDYFYEHFEDWKREHAIHHAFSLCDYGDEDEVVEVTDALFASDVRGASLFIRRALSYGARFDCEQLIELADLCDRQTAGMAVVASCDLLDEDGLEELYGVVDDGAIIEAAKRRRIRLPVCMQASNGAFDREDYKEFVEAAIITADEALECLATLHQEVERLRTISYIDLLTEHQVPSYLKYIESTGVEHAIPIVHEVINELNCRLNDLRIRNVAFVHPGRIAHLLDLCCDSSILDWASARKIEKVRKGIVKTASQVEYIRNELVRIYNE